MQHVALEMNLSETAFAHRHADGTFALRWFTPVMEVDLCGHATLATAHVLWSEGHAAPDEVLAFDTRSGCLSAERRGAWVELAFPAEPLEATVSPPGLLSALAVDPRYVGRNRFDYLVEVDSETTVRALAPDLRALPELEARGVIVTSRGATAGLDFVSRFFAPAVGIDEDSVTGSAHCCLAPYWRSCLDRAELTGFQASTRGGVVRTCVEDDRVRLGGQAVTVLRAMLTTR